MRAAPAVSCANWVTKAHTSIQGSGEHPTSPAQWLYGLSRALPGGRFATVACGSDRKLDTSFGMSGPHAFAVRLGIVRRESPSALRTNFTPDASASTAIPSQRSV